MLQLIAERKIGVTNASYKQGEIKTKNWGNQLHYADIGNSTGSTHTALCMINENKFKLASYDESIIYLTRKELQGYILEHKIQNGVLINGKFEILNTYTINHDDQFEKSIAKKYERHVALTALLGRKMEFNCTIEGYNVNILKCKGAIKDIIIPNFVTSIMTEAFYDCGAESLSIGIGLRYIGSNAFKGCDIAEVTIPETMKFIGPEAFKDNKRLVDKDGSYKDTIKILSKNTVVIQRYHTN